MLLVLIEAPPHTRTWKVRHRGNEGDYYVIILFGSPLVFQNTNGK